MEASDDILVEPPLFFAEEHVFDINFHPNSNVLACALITGQVNM